jgi:hypothetical protein
MKYILFIILCVNIETGVFAQQTHKQKITIPLGDDVVFLKVWNENSLSNQVYVHVHENEEASLAAALELTQKHPSKVVSLSHSKDGTTSRNVTFSMNEKKYSFDPNRIYTLNDELLIKHISKLSPQPADRAVMLEVRMLAEAIWTQVKDYPLIIALHNNKNQPAQIKKRWFKIDTLIEASYSVESYIQHCDHRSDSNQSCEEIYINPKMNNSEFFIVTEKSDFDDLITKKQTVVLQNSDPKDDGSMSVWAAKHQKRYINAEAKQGRQSNQLEMLKVLLGLQ